jgi:hypothetical protein
MIEMPESDWRYLQRIVGMLIERASRRMNLSVSEVLSRSDITERAKRAKIEPWRKTIVRSFATVSMAGAVRRYGLSVGLWLRTGLLKKGILVR